MAANFLIALAIAFGSATLILLVLLLLLKIAAPGAFKEKISISERVGEPQVTGSARTQAGSEKLMILEYAVAALQAPVPGPLSHRGQLLRETGDYDQKREGQESSKALVGAGQRGAHGTGSYSPS